MGIEGVSSESVIVVMDVNKNVNALDWALKSVVRPGDTVVAIGMLCQFGKKNCCFGIGISGILEKLELSSQGQAEVRPRELGEEITRKRERYRNNVQPFYRICKRNEVNLEIKLAVGFCPYKITVEQVQKSYPRWIVLDSCLKKHKLAIYQHVGCNIAVLKGKDVATLMPSRALFTPNPGKLDFPRAFSNPNINNDDDVTVTTTQIPDPNINENTTLGSVQEPGETSKQELLPQTQSPDWYPLSWRTGFPRVFSQIELEVITKGFSEEAKEENDEKKLKVYEGVLQGSPVLVQSFSENDERFWTVLQILSRVRHRNILNLVGYCCTGTSNFLLCDYPFMGTLEMNLQCDDLATKLPWKARWYIAIEIGGSLRYLHEECVDGTIVHLSVSSSNVVLSHGCTTMLGNFRAARLIKKGPPNNGDSPSECVNTEKDEWLSIDVRDYGMFLVELLSGKSPRLFQSQFSGQTLIDWALPLLEKGPVSELLDPRVSGIRDRRVDHMIIAAFLCLKNDRCSRSFSMSEILTVVRGDQLPKAN